MSGDEKRYFLVVRPDWRRGRGIFERPGRAGYTDDITQAGQFAREGLSASYFDGSHENRDAVPVEAIVEHLRRDGEALPAKLAVLDAELSVATRQLVSIAAACAVTLGLDEAAEGEPVALVRRVLAERGEARGEVARLRAANRAALSAAVAPIYFADSADYGTGLWEVVQALDPEIAELLDEDPGEAYRRVRAEVPHAG